MELQSRYAVAGLNETILGNELESSVTGSCLLLHSLFVVCCGAGAVWRGGAAVMAR